MANERLPEASTVRTRLVLIGRLVGSDGTGPRSLSLSGSIRTRGQRQLNECFGLFSSDEYLLGTMVEEQPSGKIAFLARPLVYLAPIGSCLSDLPLQAILFMSALAWRGTRIGSGRT